MSWNPADVKTYTWASNGGTATSYPGQVIPANVYYPTYTIPNQPPYPVVYSPAPKCDCGDDTIAICTHCGRSICYPCFILHFVDGHAIIPKKEEDQHGL